MSYSTWGIFLRKEVINEADALVTFYTKDFGKITVLVKGFRKIKSKMASKCQPFFLLDLTLVKGKLIDHLIGLETIKHFKFENDLKKLINGSFILTITDSLIKPYKKDKKIFFLLAKTLEILSKNNFQEEIIFLAFILKLLSFLGYRPEIFKCINCRKRIFSKKIFFSFKKGGITCEKCAEKEDLEFTRDELKILQNLLWQKFSFWKGKKIKNLEKVKEIVLKFLAWHLEKPIINFNLK